MPSASSITLLDALAGTSYTFVPLSVEPTKTVLINRDAATSAGSKVLVTGLNPATPRRQTDKVHLRLNFPIEQTIDGVVSVKAVARASVELVIPASLTADERNKFVYMAKEAVIDATLYDVAANLDPMW